MTLGMSLDARPLTVGHRPCGPWRECVGDWQTGAPFYEIRVQLLVGSEVCAGFTVVVDDKGMRAK